LRSGGGKKPGENERNFHTKQTNGPEKTGRSQKKTPGGKLLRTQKGPLTRRARGEKKTTKDWQAGGNLCAASVQNKKKRGGNRPFRAPWGGEGTRGDAPHLFALRGDFPTNLGKKKKTKNNGGLGKRKETKQEKNPLQVASSSRGTCDGRKKRSVPRKKKIRSPNGKKGQVGTAISLERRKASLGREGKSQERRSN